MRALSSRQIVDVWESGRNRSLLDRALLMLSAAHPEASLPSLARLSIGCRDNELLELHVKTFGPRFACWTNCPRCRERLEFSFEPSQLPNTAYTVASQPLTAEIEGLKVRYRAPNSEDLQGTLDSSDIAVSRTKILRRCILEVQSEDSEKPLETLSSAFLDEMDKLIGQAEPLADLQMEIRCPACGHGWLAPFDVPSYLWSEMEASAQRSLWEVHRLASAYGWSEAEILEMSPVRRRFYLETANG